MSDDDSSSAVPMSIQDTIQMSPSDAYNIIYADPPWSYNRAIGNGVLRKKDGSLHYPSMHVDELKALGPEVQRISKDDAALLLWGTMPLLQEALDVIKAWGFTYKTCFVTWVKCTKDGTRPAFGVGYYTRSNAECCFLAVKGKIPSYKKLIEGEADRRPNSVQSIVVEPRREHSRKPDVVRDKIVQVFGDLPRIEFFARTPTEGWSVLGNDTTKFEQLQLAETKHDNARRKKRKRQHNAVQ